MSAQNTWERVRAYAAAADAHPVDNNNNHHHQNNHSSGDVSRENPDSNLPFAGDEHDYECATSGKVQPKSYAGIATTDPLCVFATKVWGTEPGVHVNAMKALGVSRMREIIKKVREMPDFRFSKRSAGKTVAQARGSYYYSWCRNEATAKGRVWGE